MGNYKYKAFISYSHKDDRWGRWLHRRLETYPLPRNIVGNVTETGKIPKRLKPIFRDREELAAADNLGDKIEQALSNSENLIMICSPAAARSHWVNQEILYFKRHNRGAQIFSVIVEGEPFASNMPGREAEECFPPALRYQLDEKGALSNIPAEPLAADLRDHADGKRLGVLKLVSGMIGVGLDEVVQRDMRRTRKRMMTFTTGALLTVLVMGTLTGFALDARQKAEQRRAEAESAKLEAENRRQDAEGLIDFMIGDLRDRLKPVGRLDVLDKVAGKVQEHYVDPHESKLGCDEIRRWSHALHLAAAVAESKNEDSEEISIKALNLTEENMELCQNSADSIFDHAQSVYWAGKSAFNKKDRERANIFFEKYNILAQTLVDLTPKNIERRIELNSSYINIATNYVDPKKPVPEDLERALLIYEQVRIDYESMLQLQANKIKKEPLKLLPNEIKIRGHYVNALGHIARTNMFLKRYNKAKYYRREQIDYAKSIIKKNGDENWDTLFQIASARRNLARLEYLVGKSIPSTKQALDSEKTFEILTQRDRTNYVWARGLGKTRALLLVTYKKTGNALGEDKARERLVEILPYTIAETEKSLICSLHLGEKSCSIPPTNNQ